MKFGKLQDISNVDFSIPPDHPHTSEVLKNLPKRSGKPQVFVGCTGWGMKEWVGNVYPIGTKSKDYLRHYVRQFNTIELNTTHYRIPNADTISKWETTAPNDFQYCPKIPQTISHSRDLGKSNDSLLRFCDAISGLEQNLGCSFLQVPPYFDYQRLPALEAFLERLPNHIPLAVEIRHESWFSTPNDLNIFSKLLQKYNVATVITDVAGRRDVFHQLLTSETAMVRFVGNGLHDTDFQRIDDWVARLSDWFDKGLHQVYFFTHQPDNLLAPEMADYFANAMHAAYDVDIRGPKLNTNENTGEQMSLFYAIL